MDPISQGALGAAAPQAVLGREKLPAFAFLGCLAGMAPDLDVFIGSSTDPLLFLEYHRQFTHALLFIPIGAALVAVLLHGFVRRTLRFRETYLACLIGYATHGLLDGCTAYGTQLFWPFSEHRVGWNNVSVIDPLFTLPLLGLAILAATLRRRAFAIAGLIWALGYLLLGVVQHQRAETAGAQLAAARGHDPHRLSARPGLGNLLVWRVVYAHDGHYHVDAVRTGLTVAACPGGSVPQLDLRRDFPWLDHGSQQARDIERFSWFADDYLAVDPRVPGRIIDAGYSFMPNSIDMLWGIDLDPNAAPEQHVRYVQEARRDQIGRYWRLVTGEDCAVRLADATRHLYQETTDMQSTSSALSDRLRSRRNAVRAVDECRQVGIAVNANTVEHHVCMGRDPGERGKGSCQISETLMFQASPVRGQCRKPSPGPSSTWRRKCATKARVSRAGTATNRCWSLRCATAAKAASISSTPRSGDS